MLAEEKCFGSGNSPAIVLQTENDLYFGDFKHSQLSGRLSHERSKYRHKDKLSFLSFKGDISHTFPGLYLNSGALLEYICTIYI